MPFTFNTDTHYGSIQPGTGSTGLEASQFSVGDQGSANQWTPANYSFAQDDREEAKLLPFQPNTFDEFGNRLLTLAASIATYGATRAIDNHYGPVETNKSTAPGSYAGQNGRTYTTQPAQAGIGALASSPWLAVVAVAALAFVALK